MPKVRLDNEQLGELIDLLHGEIERLRTEVRGATPHGPDAVQFYHQEKVYLEILEILEDAV